MANTPLQSTALSPWHARQAAMLYEYSSRGYLQKLHLLVSQLIDGVVDPLLTIAAQQQRDALLVNKQWGTRDTSDNWANNAWPFLKDLQASLSKDIALRAFDKYKMTATNECLRGAEQYSMLWTTPEEERQYLAAVALINAYAGRIDSTLDVHQQWDDYGFAYEYAGFAAESPRIPQFRVRPDLMADTGKMPPRTGVYMAFGDPHAALQFAAAGKGGIPLREAATFNDVGLDALATVGREHLWFDGVRMLDFAKKSKYPAKFFDVDDSSGNPSPILAPSAVALAAFTSRPATWQFVEIIPDQFENVEIAWNPAAQTEVVRRLAGGELCQVAGFYFSPARDNSRQFFKSCERMPIHDAVYGQTIWQWDAKQD